MSDATVVLSGYRECLAALQRVNRDVRRDISWELAEAAKPVQRGAQQRISRYREASIGTIGTSVRSNGVFVRQNKSKVTGKRPDFGALQMRKGFIPALQAAAPEIEARIGYAVDNIVAAFGE